MTAATRRPAAKAGQQKKETAAAAATTKAAAAGPSAAAPSPSRGPAYFFFQYGGLALCTLGVALLWAGYGKGWMHDTYLTLLCVALNCAGLFVHETRPFSVSFLFFVSRRLGRPAPSPSLALSAPLSASFSRTRPPRPKHVPGKNNNHSSSAPSRSSARPSRPPPRSGSRALPPLGRLFSRRVFLARPPLSPRCFRRARQRRENRGTHVSRPLSLSASARSLMYTSCRASDR